MARTVIITGTNRGIGKAILKRFSREKDAIILAHARRETSEFLEYISELKSKSECFEIEPFYFDLREPENIKKELTGVIKKHKKIDVLINNAGVVMPVQSFLMADMKMIRESFEVNFFAQVYITQLVCRSMIRNKSGAIVNMSSVAAFSGIEGQFEYTCSKSALIGMTKRLANELAPYNIRSNAVAPGMVDTDMIMQMEDNMRNRLIENLISKRLAKPEEIANAVYFLASDEASYINGQILLVNGGGVNF